MPASRVSFDPGMLRAQKLLRASVPGLLAHQQLYPLTQALQQKQREDPQPWQDQAQDLGQQQLLLQQKLEVPGLGVPGQRSRAVEFKGLKRISCAPRQVQNSSSSSSGCGPLRVHLAGQAKTQHRAGRESRHGAEQASSSASHGQARSNSSPVATCDVTSPMVCEIATGSMELSSPSCGDAEQGGQTPVFVPSAAAALPNSTPGQGQGIDGLCTGIGGPTPALAAAATASVACSALGMYAEDPEEGPAACMAACFPPAMLALAPDTVFGGATEAGLQAVGHVLCPLDPVHIQGDVALGQQSCSIAEAVGRHAVAYGAGPGSYAGASAGGSLEQAEGQPTGQQPAAQSTCSGAADGLAPAAKNGDQAASLPHATLGTEEWRGSNSSLPCMDPGSAGTPPLLSTPPGAANSLLGTPGTGSLGASGTPTPFKCLVRSGCEVPAASCSYVLQSDASLGSVERSLKRRHPLSSAESLKLHCAMREHLAAATAAATVAAASKPASAGSDSMSWELVASDQEGCAPAGCPSATANGGSLPQKCSQGRSLARSGSGCGLAARGKELAGSAGSVSSRGPPVGSHACRSSAGIQGLASQMADVNRGTGAGKQEVAPHGCELHDQKPEQGQGQGLEPGQEAVEQGGEALPWAADIMSSSFVVMAHVPDRQELRKRSGQAGGLAAALRGSAPGAGLAQGSVRSSPPSTLLRGQAGTLHAHQEELPALAGLAHASIGRQVGGLAAAAAGASHAQVHSATPPMAAVRAAAVAGSSAGGLPQALQCTQEPPSQAPPGQGASKGRASCTSLHDTPLAAAHGAPGSGSSMHAAPPGSHAPGEAPTNYTAWLAARQLQLAQQQQEQRKHLQPQLLLTQAEAGAEAQPAEQPATQPMHEPAAQSVGQREQAHEREASTRGALTQSRLPFPLMGKATGKQGAQAAAGVALQQQADTKAAPDVLPSSAAHKLPASGLTAALAAGKASTHQKGLAEVPTASASVLTAQLHAEPASAGLVEPSDPVIVGHMKQEPAGAAPVMAADVLCPAKEAPPVPATAAAAVVYPPALHADEACDNWVPVSRVLLAPPPPEQAGSSSWPPAASFLKQSMGCGAAGKQSGSASGSSSNCSPSRGEASSGVSREGRYASATQPSVSSRDHQESQASGMTSCSSAGCGGKSSPGTPSSAESACCQAKAHGRAGPGRLQPCGEDQAKSMTTPSGRRRASTGTGAGQHSPAPDQGRMDARGGDMVFQEAGHGESSPCTSSSESSCTGPVRAAAAVATPSECEASVASSPSPAKPSMPAAQLQDHDQQQQWRRQQANPTQLPPLLPDLHQQSLQLPACPGFEQLPRLIQKAQRPDTRKAPRQAAAADNTSWGNTSSSSSGSSNSAWSSSGLTASSQHMSAMGPPATGAGTTAAAWGFSSWMPQDWRTAW